MAEPTLQNHTVRVRYGEVDQQGVVFNAHYLAYIDDALERWLAPIVEDRREERWDMMLKKVTLEWQGSLGNGDHLGIDFAVTRWGRTSWDVTYRGSCEGRPIFLATVVYISVRVPENEAMETPESIRAYMGEAVDPAVLASSD